jgi:hypothetical protein
VNVDLSILQAGINNKVQISTVDINDKFKILTSTDNNFKIQRKIGTVLYDSLDLIFNDTDKRSIIKINNIDILDVLSSRAAAADVYSKQQTDINDTAVGIALNNRAPLSSVNLGGVYRLSKSTDNNTFSIDRYDNSGFINANGWVSLLSLVFNDETNSTKFYVNKLNIFDLINAKVNTSVLSGYQEQFLINDDLGASLLVSTDNNQLCNLEGIDDIQIIKTYDNLNTKGIITRINNRIQIKLSPDLITSINGKANTSVTYTKTETNNLLNNKFRGTIKTAPIVNNAESGIGFYKYADMRDAAAGDLWAIGQNNWGTTNDFNIGTPIKNSGFKISEDGTVTIPYNLVVNGSIDFTFKNSCFHVAGKIDGNNLNALSSRGRFGFNVSRPTSGTFPIGVYYIEFNIPYDNDNYVINTTNQMAGHCKVWDSANYLPNSNGFILLHIIYLTV